MSTPSTSHAVTLAPEGTYRDPTTPGPLGRSVLPGYMAALFEGFADFQLSYWGPGRRAC
ncbi:MAG: hypothetical protein RL489_1979 [Pseudomonadota bacterium]|jgi:hypothetical protein